MGTFCKTDTINLGRSLTERPDPTVFERHCHQKYELLHIVRGRGKCIVEGSEYPMTDGAVFLLRPFEYHYVCPDPGYTYERYVSNFTSEALLDATRELPMISAKSHGVYFPPEVANNNFCNVIAMSDKLFEADEYRSPRAEAMAISLLNQLLLLLGGGEDSSHLRPADEPIGDIIDYLNRHLDEKITLEQTAKRFFISKYYLCHLFRKHTGVTVLAYLNSKRIALAQHLIASGEPPTEVAYRVGFQDYSTFFRAYKKETGRAPTEVASRSVRASDVSPAAK
ncbi:MAG: helix-turn-helix transcriptional regulator [Clostridia bacterium]|nr:helix-turn-helix transcriptional regulator [Clostridia bacterium]